jgi:hypothetical protein
MQARQCYQDILRRNGAVQEGIRAYYRIGQALRTLVPVKHGMKYGKNLVGEFIDEWTIRGGFRFGPGQAKYCRLFAGAFDDKLLQQAIDAKIGWTALKELSGSELLAQDRRNVIRRVLCNKLAPSQVVAEVRALTGASQKAPRKLRVKSARRLPSILSRQLESCARALERLDTAMEHLTGIKNFSPQDVVDVCEGVINAGTLAKQCGLSWTAREKKARQELARARDRIAGEYRT